MVKNLNKFTESKKLEVFCEDVFLRREIFNSNTDFGFWKTSFFNLKGISNLLASQLKGRIWHGTDLEKPIRDLRKITNKFIKTIKREGTDHGSWSGADDRCISLIEEYRHDVYPQIETLVHSLAPDHPLRLKIEENLTL
ncbi:MAG: hypothetical protein ACTSWW_08220 [Promethearchaeota archaeon]